MKKNLLTYLFSLLLGTNLCFAQTQNSARKIILENGEKVWAGVIGDG